MAFLLHQNMLNWTGGNLVKNRAMTFAFRQIVGAVPGQLLCMGLTEVRSRSAGCLAAIHGVFGALQLAPVVVARNIRSVAEYREFIAIGLNRNAPLRHLESGRMYFVGDVSIGGDQHPRLGVDVAPGVGMAAPNIAAWSEDWPEDAQPDFRAIVYVIMAFTGARRRIQDVFGIGFLHNNYEDVDRRSVIAQRIPDFLNLLRDRCQLYAQGMPVNVYVGGDFNVAPQDRRTTAGSEAYRYATGLASLGDGTTTGHNLYDYWFSQIRPNSVSPIVPNGINFPVPGATDLTVDPPLMSDHALVWLRIT